VTNSANAEMFVLDSPYEVARWRPLAHWAMFIPHAIIQNGLRALAGAAALIYWLALIFTGRLNRGLYGILAMSERYSQRANGFLVGFTETYAPFDFDMGATDNQAYPPIRVNLPEPSDTTPRTAAFNILLAIPHYIVLALFIVAAFIVLIIGWFAVLFTGAWPQGMRDFLVKFNNYYLRVWAYVTMVHTSYPRFGL